MNNTTLDSPALASLSSFSAITDLMKKELSELNSIIEVSLSSRIEAVNQIAHHIISSGGKRIRPILFLLCTKLCHPHQTQPTLQMAAIIEFIHTATLLHDDVVDAAHLRRGHPTVNAIWDNASAVLVGDFLYSRAFQMMVALNNMEAMRILSDTTNTIAEGEVLQLSCRRQLTMDETRYLQIIYYKTAKLFEASAQLGALLTEQTKEKEQALASYGKHLGMAFQLMDDLLDYAGDTEAFGKNIGADLNEGKMTLPLIYALQTSSPQHALLLKEAIQTGFATDLSAIQEIIVSSGAIDYTMVKAKQEVEKAKQALCHLPPCLHRTALTYLAEFAITRNF